VITNKVQIDRNIMDACPTLKLICVAATGINNVDLEAAKEKNIQVRNVSGYSTESVTQSTFSILFQLLNKTSQFDSYVKSGKYAQSNSFTWHGQSFWELKGKQAGIIGLGTIGKRVAEIFKAFGTHVVYYSTSGKNMDAEYEQISLEDLFKTSDIISVHCPLNEKTENLIHLEILRLMKPTAYLINTARGKIVNEADLAFVLNNNLIAGAGIDVYSSEPIAEDNPLLSVTEKDKIVLTPHIAWISKEAREQLIEGIYQNISEWKNSLL
jgi:glycerate dehydrogenase